MVLPGGMDRNTNSRDLNVKRITMNNNTDNQEWPDFEPENTFDWSLSQREIEKKYLPLVIKNEKTRVKFIKPEPVEDTIVYKPCAAKFINALKHKYPYAFDLISTISPDMPRWIFENLITKPIIP